MKRKNMRSILLSSFMLVAALSAPWPAAAQDAKQPYASMAPMERYLMDRNAEIALARSAAPDAISRDATTLVLGRHGYETAVEGKNGWVCMVERGWMAPFLLGQREPLLHGLELHTLGFCVTDRKASKYATHFVLEKVAIQS